MSILRVNKIVASSDFDFEIQMPPSANLYVRGTLAFDANSDFRLPAGTTNQRPVSPVAGMIRFNTTNNNIEGYNGTAWINIMSPAVDGAGEVVTTGLPQNGLVIHLDANNTNSLLPTAADQDANYWYNLVENNLHFGIPTDRISQESINGNVIKYLDFSDNGSGCAKLQNDFLDVPWFPHCTVIFFLRWRTTDSQWRTPLRSRDNDHQIMVRDGAKDLGVYDNNGAGFIDSGYNIDQFPDWNTKFNMYTWRLSTYESGQYSPNYQCYFKDEATARATLNSSSSRYDRGFYSIGAYHNGNVNPHDSSQNAGSFPVFMYYQRHITQAERTQIYNYYKDAFAI